MRARELEHSWISCSFISFATRFLTIQIETDSVLRFSLVRIVGDILQQNVKK
jgi:hypothetical protein